MNKNISKHPQANGEPISVFVLSFPYQNMHGLNHNESTKYLLLKMILKIFDLM